MKTSRFQYDYRIGASKLHKKIGDVLRDPKSIFSRYKVFQEYPVSRINSSYKNNKHKFDWVILDLYLVIEAHGQHHYASTTYGGISKEQAEENFIDQKFRDTQKMDAAIEAGYTYLEIPYTDIDLISDEYILSLYNEYKNNNIVKNIDTKVKEQRKSFYLKQKEFIKSIKNKRL